MRTTYRSVLAAGAVAVLVAGLAACSGGDTAGTGTGAEKVVFWGSWSGDQVAQLEAQADAFNESQDDYEVTYVPQELVEEQLLTGLASGDVPDVVLWDRYNTPIYVPTNALAPLDEYIDEDGVDLGQFYDQALGELVIDDVTYGIPLLVDNRSLFYNVTALAEAGVEPPTNWDELRAAAEATTVRDGGTLTRAGFQLNDPGLFNMWLTQAGGQMYSEDGETTAFNSPQGLEVLDFWQSMLDAGVYELGFGEGVDAFAEGNVALKLDGPWALSGLDKTDTEYGIVQPPAGPTGDRGAGMGGFGLVIPQGAKNADGAWEFIKWWTTQPENGVSFGEISGWIPANIEAANDAYFTENPKYAAFIETLEYAKVRSRIPGASDVEGKALIPALEKFLAGEVTAEQALSEAQELGDQILADNR
ncbi:MULTISPECIES: ABC transporter substrate-binding protein [Microbacterium]|uniref:ABC transporter substrate-binding protein n=1 Tax=Microbacterium wangchenii TaxID=2541726 RepID=A0ABX5SZD5_9MICO|nr:MULTISPECIES: ABC transporter substrate-binding protein [Microbacterium]MCK6066190.1 ABC transporter substrate-binding protein [Microbacterium sp. EYE_512]QBR90463.1 ABC transporter substrate-binding protein [Microbacterium wangchenii]TXK14489.1 ABC transporter substrate-binding protein [Microbacterium wangchenii]